MNTTRSIFLMLCAGAASLSCLPATATAAKKHSHAYTKGTNQMPGGAGVFGQTYTLVSSDGFGPVNFAIVSAEYSVTRVDIDAGDSYAPKAGEKLFVIHYRMKNPNPSDMYYSSRSLFQAVDQNDNTIDDSGLSRRASETQAIAMQIKPGQGIDDLFTYIVVPAQGSIPKLILKLGRAGSTDLVTRYALGSGVNVVKPLPAPYADPADKSGATALQVVPAVVGTTYTAGYFDVSLDSLAVAPGPFGSLTADSGNQFLVATVTVTNKSFAPIYMNDSMINATLTTDDDKITDSTTLKADHDDPFEGRSVDPNETVRERVVLQYPTDSQLKTLSLAEAVDNTGGLSRAFSYDLSGVK